MNFFKNFIKTSLICVNFLFLTESVAQKKVELRNSFTELEKEKQVHIDAIDEIEKKQKLITDTISMILLDSLKDVGVTAKVGRGRMEGKLKETPEPTGKVIEMIPEGESIKVIEFLSEEYYYYAAYGGKLGYISDLYLFPNAGLNQLKELSQSKQKEGKKGSQSSLIAPSYSSPNYGTGKVIHTGPRGGRYYINKNGNKTYIKR